MKIKSKVTGQIIDVSDEGGKKLIEAKLYDAVDETKVEPMTTESMPARTKKAR